MSRAGLTLVVLSFLAAACESGPSTVVDEQAAAVEATPPPEPATEDEHEATTTPPDSEPEATLTPAADLESSEEPTSVPTLEPLPAAPVTLDRLLAFSPNGAFAYETLGNPWHNSRDCDSDPAPSLVVIDITASDESGVVAFAGGLATIGLVTKLLFDRSGAGVALDMCGSRPDTVHRLTPVVVGSDGRITATGRSTVISDSTNVHDASLRAVEAPGIGVAEVTIGDDGDYDNWIREFRRYDLTTGEFEVLSGDTARRLTSRSVTTPDGRFSYSVIDDPYGDVGCEGLGVASTLAVDDGSGSGSEPVWGPDQPTYGMIFDMHFGPEGLVAWSSGCEDAVVGVVGRVLGDGSIVDQHWLDVYGEGEVFHTFRAYRLSADGDMIALGLRFGGDTDGAEPIVRRFDLGADPHFVNTGSVTPWVDVENPLAETLAGTGHWHVGEDLGSAPGCGDRTLYASTTAGYVRGLRAGEPLDAVVDLAVSVSRTARHDTGYSFETRAIAVLTECPDAYEGHQLWFARERDVPASHLDFRQADLAPVAELIGLREEPSGDDPYFHDIYAEVMHLDGTVAEVLLEAVARSG